MKNLKILLLLTFAFTSAVAQRQHVIANSVNVDELPEYVVIRSATALIGSMIIVVERENSPHKPALARLEDLLESRYKLRIQNLTDLLNALSDVGFDYVNAFSIGDGGVTGMVFRKKPEYR